MEDDEEEVHMAMALKKLRAEVAAMQADREAERREQERKENSASLIAAMLNEDGDQVTNILQNPGEMDWTYQDARGMTAMHHACRAMNPEWVESILQHHPGACNALTWSTGVPGRWSPLQCLVDNANPTTDEGENKFYKLVDLVAENTDIRILLNQTSTGNTVFHQVASRGHRHLVDLLAQKFGNHTAEAINIKNYAMGNRPDSHCLIQ